MRHDARAVDAVAFSGVPGVAHTYDLRVIALQPGTYLLRFSATAAGRRAEREVRFSVR